MFARTDVRRLAAVRIGLCGLLALRLAISDYGAVTDQPAALYQPVSYMHLLDYMPSHVVATTLQVCGIGAALVATVGLVLRISLPLALGCSLILNGMLSSTGKINYNDVLLTLCLLLLVAAGSAAGEAWSMRGLAGGSARRLRRGQVPPTSVSSGPSAVGERYGWPIRTAMLVIALTYFLAAMQKWRYSGLSWVTSDNLRWILYAASDKQSRPNAFALFIADRPLLAHLFAAGSLLLETCFPLVLLVPRLRWLLVPGVVAMHVGIRLAIGLDYSAQWLTVLIVFINWPVAVAWLQNTVARVPPAVRGSSA